MTNFVELEKKILALWEREKTFKKLQKKLKGKKTFSFIDGPITANNKMGVHHAWGRTIKDTFQRYKAMRGFDQRWQNGFDCQGLWVEVEVEKDLDLNSKKDIERFGLAKFSRECEKRVDKFATIIMEQSKRLGQWMDWENSYFTHSEKNIEYIWHFLKTIHQKGWLYKDKRVLPWCKRCGTSLSSHEMADSYKEIVHPAVTVRFKLKDGGEIFVWTTTPWTLPANTALAVHSKGRYKKLLGKEYIGPFGNKGKIIPWDEVDEKEGTGIVHIAPSCGEEDFALAKKYNLPIGETPIEFDNQKIIKELKKRGFLERLEEYTHRYPVCWRCKKELVFKLDSEWFISSREIRLELKKEAKKVNWLPKGIGARMQNWLRNMGDWNISRKRFWGLPLPFYECVCGELVVVGSKKELSKLSGIKNLLELHRPWVDKVKIKCPKCRKTISRVPEVGDCWLDAGIVPFSTLKYLEDKKYWRKWFPVEFISEMREQIRLWYYSMLFMSVALEGKSPYKNVLSYEKVYDEKGQPMHKSAGNAIWFDQGVERMGADVMRWLYLRQSPKFNLLFGYNAAKDIHQLLNTYWNSFVFYRDYITKERKTRNTLDDWILSRLNQAISEITKKLDKYNTDHSARVIELLIDDLSNWYIRRTRKEANKQVLKNVLIKLSRLMAPFAPFLTEEVYRGLTGELSVHLSDWPKPLMVDEKLIKEMEDIREICTKALAQRKHKVRQPLAKLEINKKFDKQLIELIKEEVNVKKVVFGKKLRLDNTLTPSLKKEGKDRDLIRKIQLERKEAGLRPEDWIVLTYPEAVSDLVRTEVKAQKTKKGEFRVDKI